MVLRAAVLLVAALVLGFLIIRVSTSYILLGRGHSAIALLSPNDPAVVLESGRREFQQRGEIGEDTLRDVLAAARRAPLAEEPFFLAAVSTGAAQDRARTMALLEEARRRNPRARFARLLLVEQYIRAGRIGEATVEIKVLSGLMSEVSSLLEEQLARLALDPQTRPALTRAVGDDPLLDNVLTQLVRRGASPRLVLELAAPRMRLYSPDRPPEWQRELLGAQVERGDYRTAFALWRQFNRVDAQPGALYNPGFATVRGSPPFNWELIADANGVAERGRDGALDILYFGRADTRLARQLVLLPPGRYRLQLVAASGDQAGGSRLAWRVGCAAGGTRLANLPLDDLSSTPRLRRADFEVPATGCGAQWLELVGEAAEFPTRREVKVTGFRLGRAGGAS